MSFPYRTLGQNQIRLLKPRDTAFNALAYDLIHVDITTKVEYSALSYTWGVPGDSHVIQLDGEWFPVRENLYDALLALGARRRGTPNGSIVRNHIWVDAICINQGHDERALAERSLQITLMTRIYEQASTILVWLGKPLNETNNRLAFRKLEEFNQHYLWSMKQNRPYRPWWWPHRATLPEHDMSSFLGSISPTDRAVLDVEGSDTHNAWLGICAVLKSSWWTRTWVFQEATVPEKHTVVFVRGVQMHNSPSKVKFLCGTETTSWVQLINTISVATHLQGMQDLRASFINEAHRAAALLIQFRSFRIQNLSPSFFQILQLFRHTECFDPRDKVYAPLYLASEHVISAIKPDYNPTNTVLDVYIDVVRFGLKQAGKSLDFLGFASWTSKPRRPFPADWRLTEIPSWVPNWFEPAYYVPIPKVLYIENTSQGRAFSPYDRRGLPSNNEQQIRSFNATGNSASTTSIDGTNLRIEGVLCGNIKEIMPPPGPKPSPSLVEEIRRWESVSRGKYPTGETFSQALNRTQAMDLKYDWRGRACGRGGYLDFNLLNKYAADMDAASLESQGRMKSAFFSATNGRNVCLLDDGYLGMAPLLAEVGDLVFAFRGGQVLYTLRPEGSFVGRYSYIGETYVHGFMDGEVMRRLEVGEASVQDLVLV
jgi:hypothetical protein